MGEYSPAKVRKMVGYMDLILTTILFFQIFYYQLCPLVPKGDDAEPRKEHVRKEGCSGICQSLELWPLLTVPPLNANYGPGTWTYTFMGIFPVLTFIPMMTAICLVDSASPNVEDKQVLGFTKLWMRCNYGTIFLSAVGFCVVLEMYMVGYPVGLPIPTLLYIGFRVGGTLLISKQLNSKEFLMIEEACAAEWKEEEDAGYQEIMDMLLLNDRPRVQETKPTQVTVA